MPADFASSFTPNSDKEVVHDTNIPHPCYAYRMAMSKVKKHLVSGNASALLRENLHNPVNASF